MTIPYNGQEIVTNVNSLEIIDRLFGFVQRNTYFCLLIVKQIENRINMSKRGYYVFYMLALVLMSAVVVSCGSTKKIKKDSDKLTSNTSSFQTTTFFNSVVANKSTAEYLTSKIKAKITSGSKDISTGGNLRMKRDEVIQISLVDPILGITEVARLEFSKDRVLFIDRVHKRYADVPYSSVDFLQKANIDFNSLQSLFWSELFKPGASQVQASDFKIAKADAKNVNLDYTDRVLNYQFVATADDALLNKTHITGTNSSTYSLSCDYDDYAEFNGKKFPKDIILSFASATKTNKIELQLSNISQNSNWATRTDTPSGKYTKVSADELFKSLTK